jgi:cellulose synthase/poly-beta-1,6-N-acetylglucosamine synthase-like glycosyltransferase
VIHVVHAFITLIVVFSLFHYGVLLSWGVVSTRFLHRRRPAVRRAARQHVEALADLPAITVVMPVYNEEVVVVDAVRSVLGMHYPSLEVIVVSDGSKDRTIEVLVEAFGLEPMGAPANCGPIPAKPIREVYRSRSERRLVVVDKDNGGKGDSLNLGTNLSTCEWVVAMDGDALVDPQVLIRCMTEVVHSNGNPVAVGVSLLPTNSCVVEHGRVTDARVPHNFWVGCQLVEYLCGFLLARPGMSSVSALPIISGCFGLFRRDVILRVGGYRHPHLGEDLDLIVRIHESHQTAGETYQVLQVPEALVWTEFPSSHQVLKRQRVRWHRGLRQVIEDNRGTILRSRYGRFGVLGMGTMFFFEWVAVLVEALGYVLLPVFAVMGLVNGWAAVGLLMASQMIGVFITTMAVWSANRFLNRYSRGRDILLLLAWAVVSQFGFRQMTVWWRVKSLKRGDMAWGAMTRKGFKPPPMAQKPAPAPGA